MYGRKSATAKLIHQWLTQLMETGSMLKQNSPERPWIWAGVECIMLSCVWSSQKYVSDHTSQLRISKTMIQNTLYMKLRSHIYNLQLRHNQTDPMKCSKYGHWTISTTREYKEFVIQVPVTIVGMLYYHHWLNCGEQPHEWMSSQLGIQFTATVS